MTTFKPATAPSYRFENYTEVLVDGKSVGFVYGRGNSWQSTMCRGGLFNSMQAAANDLIRRAGK